MIRILILTVNCIVFSLSLFAQNAWEVPEKESNTISFLTFDEDFALSGQLIYENSCTSCHGAPGMANFTMMSPSPGDVASERFQVQKDGQLFYKIKHGRETMPSFEEALGDEEIWQLVAFIRSFNEKYEQPIPNLEGIEIPKLSLKLDFDDNVDKLVVKVYNEDSIPIADASVSAFIKSMFGKLPLGKSTTNKLGIAYFDVDASIPGDEEGQLVVIAKASKGYGSEKIQGKLKMVEPTVKLSANEGRHLWSKRIDAPFWLQVIFHATIFGIWVTLFFVIFGLRKIRKLS